MVAEVIHGAPARFTDPARFSLAHGGTDRHPYSVPIRVYDETIRVLKSAVSKAQLGRSEELGALRRLDAQACQLEMLANGPSLEAHIARERARSPSYDGRSVFGWEADFAESPGGRPQRRRSGPPQVASHRSGGRSHGTVAALYHRPVAFEPLAEFLRASF